MLERILVVLHIIVEVVWIRKEIAVCGEDVFCGNVGSRQPEAFRLLDFINLPLVVAEVFAEFVTQVGVCRLVADHLYRVVDADCAVVGGQHHAGTALGYAAQQVACR